MGRIKLSDIEGQGHIQHPATLSSRVWITFPIGGKLEESSRPRLD